jgi:hypothetical protein
MKLLALGNAKTMLGEGRGFLTGILHLAPYTTSGHQVCPMASKGCAAACLNLSGRGRFAKTQEARIRKTRWFFSHRAEFMATLVKDIEALIRKAEREDKTPVVRLNGTSDLRWEIFPVDGQPNIFARFPTVQFYDYTKIANRRDLPANYHLTFSRAESNHHDVVTAMRKGLNVAVAFHVAKGEPLPAEYLGREVINGDVTDLRFLDKGNVVVGLRAKGKNGKLDASGFVVPV